MTEGRQYKVLGAVGRGGFGTVYRAELSGEGGFSKVVALKVLNPDMEEVGEMAVRLRDEARVLGLLQHRAIVQVDGLVRLSGRWTVVMEYVEGADLKQVIASAGKIPPTVALTILEDVPSHAIRPLRHVSLPVAPAGRGPFWCPTAVEASSLSTRASVRTGCRRRPSPRDQLGRPPATVDRHQVGTGDPRGHRPDVAQASNHPAPSSTSPPPHPPPLTVNVTSRIALQLPPDNTRARTRVVAVRGILARSSPRRA